ncbi:MAG: hypothetical protein IT353_18480 [Gemmatimonadaceae bacterium]|nr:hypothetical protein [Gemmatimonadaceae bacterium]
MLRFVDFLHLKLWMPAPIGCAVFLALLGVLRLRTGRDQSRSLFVGSTVLCGVALGVMLILRLTYAYSMQLAYHLYTPLTVLSFVLGLGLYVSALAFVHSQLRARGRLAVVGGVAVSAVLAYPISVMAFFVCLCKIRGGCI